ncbi:hypothetical protein CO172_02445 [Candidatus Uhrbacteria bacterium CG_4_9_14_3_um_filter_36_7]|uniref:Lycopene cyclase domain-containing protein n=1 Tax=Candidatus Uhrbacteria bacterium CG_4_9_14_3_um_filter_36_7 TaxID=1975033 RepID=A0A2M7XHB4_9BACT|nr:MAG: hypothetical protein CO172_02445 [Candidatus Uhrbacteria bacterium CG_4_9_14_3_um_filter_36_7]
MFGTPLFFLSLSLFLLWCLLFFLSKKTRVEQILISLAGLFLTPGILWLVIVRFVQGQDFIHISAIRWEDLLFVFSLCGISAVIYEILFASSFLSVKKKKKIKIDPSASHWFFVLIFILSIWSGLSLLLTFLFEQQIIFAFVVAGLLVGIYMLIGRRDLIGNAIISGCFIMLLLWLLEGIFSIRLSFIISQIPSTSKGIEQWLWFGTIGFTLGPLYEYVRHYRIRS